MSARILVAGRSEICRELFNDPEAYGSQSQPVVYGVLHYFIMEDIRLIG